MTDDFYLGALLGLFLMMLLWLYSSRLRSRYFVQCSRDARPVCLEGRLFYVVAAADYVVSSLNSDHRRKSDATPQIRKDRKNER